MRALALKTVVSAAVNALRYSLGLLVCALALTACGKDPAHETLGLTTENAILPLYADFAAASEQLLADNEQFCKRPDADGLATIQEQWRRTMLGWQAAQVILFGPIAVDNQSWHLQFWPDKKNLTARKTEALLAGDQAIDDAALEHAGVIVQGLSAMEYLLFDPASAELNKLAETRRCELLVAQARQINRVATGLLDHWRSGYGKTFSNPGEGNATFPNAATAIGALVDSLALQAEVVARRKLAEPLGLGSRSGIPQPYSAESWRSRHSLANIGANLRGIDMLYSAGLETYLVTRDQAALAQTLRRQLDTTRSALDAAMTPLFDAATQPQTREQLGALQAEVAELVRLLKRELPPALGVSLGFNSNDGD